MAQYDTADLVRRFRRLASRPATDTSLDVPDIYAYLTDGQLYWLRQFQVHFPRLNWTVWEKLTPSADKKSYSLSAVPLGPLEIYSAKGATTELIAGAPWSLGSDFTWEGGDTIRFPNDQPRHFADGPWARYVPTPDPIGEETEPVIEPADARLLVVYQALWQWAHEGNLHDPSVYADLMDGVWLGQRPGDIGLLGAMKARYGSNSSGNRGPWYKNPDMSGLPVATR